MSSERLRIVTPTGGATAALNEEPPARTGARVPEVA